MTAAARAPRTTTSDDPEGWSETGHAASEGGGVSLGLPRGPVRLLRSHPRLLRGREGSEKPRGSLRRSAYIGFSSIETAPRQHADRGSERKLAAQ
ncbi:unnamed protein product [Prorocentrum cordatum]|uniref:Uncharacterized protein n=1 Tax=Prorocentrum cordatum TaxID=2364126 RepID=A0ABN9URX0_9DINO|nr:unnamed protein product [Polarella glacialis]